MMRAELGFPGRDVDADRAVRLASLAGEAQRQRILDRVAVPAVGDYLAARHFMEKVRTPAGRMLLLPCSEVGRAHHLVADLPPPALADADAARRRMRERAVVVGVSQMRFERPRLVGQAEAQVGVDRERLDRFSGIEPVLRIPDRLEPAEALDQLVAVHDAQELRARLTIAMLARKRTTVAVYQRRRFAHELAILSKARLAVKIEVHTAVRHAVAEVAVERSGVAVLGEQALQLAQIGSELVRRNGAVLPAWPVLGLSAHERGCTEGRLARFPDAPLFARVGDDAYSGACPGPVDHAADLRLGLFPALPARFDDQEAAALGERREPAMPRPRFAHGIIELAVEPLDRIGLLLQERWHCVRRSIDVVEREQSNRLAARSCHELHDGLEQDDTTALRACHRLGNIEVAARKQRIEVLEARDEPRDLREALLDQRPITVS